MRRYACSFDWDRVFNTCDPEYYRWNQWFFLQMFERGLAYRKDSAVNWCPNYQTVLANEQVVGGPVRALRHPRHQEEADAVVPAHHRLRRPPARRHAAARGRLAGEGAADAAQLDRALRRRRGAVRHRGPRRARHRLHDATRHAVRRDLLRRGCRLRPGGRAGRGHLGARPSSRTYLEKVKQVSEIDRLDSSRAKTGVFLQRYAVNPVNGERIPVWASDYVLADYGTGAIMAVPAHDQRDLDFARAFDLPVRVVVDGGRGPGGDRRRHCRRRPARELGSAGRARQGRRDRRDHRGPGGARHRPAGHQLPPARLADLAPALLGHADPDRPLPVVRRGAGARRPAAGHAAARRGPRPQAQGHVAAGRGDRLGHHDVPAVRRARAARHRHDGHVRRLVLVLPALRRPHERRLRRSTRPSCASGCPSTSTSAA